MKKITLILVLLSFGITNSGYSQGKLDIAEKSLSKRESNNTSRNDSRSGSDDNYESTDWGDMFIVAELGLFAAEAFLYATYFTAIETPMEAEHRATGARITKYPYLNSKIGNYAYDSGENTTQFRATISNRYIIENQKLYGNHLNADLRFLERIGFEADYLQLWEDNTNFGVNTLAIFTAMAKYHRVRTEKFNAWWGVGTTYVGGEVDEFGFAYGVGAELFFAKPLSIETNFYGAYINQRPVNRLSALLNYHYKRLKFSGGYEHLRIGSLDLSTFSGGMGVSF
ncbi:hypothetical protein D1816_18500 [Aquimarina sp. AD10]|uniref:hypothetical protein n=1 Tax=Aquimarina sp. AD10 TaxID=1714849 RepID=UPI000E540784|nr:hypothetical protein [Aquimarina sp. AD10]AXT62268.1 hypothetical protein D1816_18500 [Aquimarina sp. AD10]RKM90537.1 hypothetical protein D7033_23880 [Aquimarina sp. AD10]